MHDTAFVQARAMVGANVRQTLHFKSGKTCGGTNLTQTPGLRPTDIDSLLQDGPAMLCTLASNQQLHKPAFVEAQIMTAAQVSQTLHFK